jgi:hypothetical protein
MSDAYVCPQCQLDYDSLDPAGLGGRIRTIGPALRTRLAGLDDRTARTRPEPAVWSAVEYAAHLADAYDAFVEMVDLMPTGASMTNFFWDPDERAAEQQYAERSVTSVLAQLDTDSNRLADALDQVPTPAWHITAEFPWGERDLLTMARNAVHEGVHHTQDIDTVLERVSAASH